MMADYFDDWVSGLPDKRKFRKTEPSDPDGYEKWKAVNGIDEETEDYDTVGAYESGQNPDEDFHLGSFGKGGKLLKSPEHETVWKTAFTEIFKEYVGVYPEIGDLTREEANEAVEYLIKKKYGDTNPSKLWSYD